MGAFAAVLFALLFHSVVFGLVYGLVSTVLRLYFWRPGGMARRRYEQWCARFDPANRPVVLPDGAPSPGWYADPRRRNRVHYWTGSGWA